MAWAKPSECCLSRFVVSVAGYFVYLIRQPLRRVEFQGWLAVLQLSLASTLVRRGAAYQGCEVRGSSGVNVLLVLGVLFSNLDKASSYDRDPGNGCLGSTKRWTEDRWFQAAVGDGLKLSRHCSTETDDC